MKNNNQRTPNNVGDALPPTAPECLEAPKESGLLRSLGRRVLSCLLPERQKTEDTNARTLTPQPSSESVDDARSLEGEGDVVDETLHDERIGETPMLTESFDQVAEEIDAIYGADNSQDSVVYGNKWFNALPSLKVEVLVGLSNSYSDLWVNIPSTIPPSPEIVEARRRSYAQLSTPERNRRLDEFLSDLRAAHESHKGEEADAA